MVRRPPTPLTVRAGPGWLPGGGAGCKCGTSRPGLLAPGPEVADQLADERLGPGGRLAAEKTFDLRDAVVAVAPLLHGLPVSMLDSAVDRVLSDERAVALPAVAGARGPVWAAACVLEDERLVAELADALVERPAPAVLAQVANSAVLGTELGRGPRLNERESESSPGVAHLRALA